MIYTIDDVKKEIRRYFTQEVEGNNKDIIQNTIELVESILENENVLEACKDIRNSIINLTIEGKAVYKDKKFLPDWVKYLVYVVIYQYLSSNRKPKYTQSTLLKEMGLYTDIFGKKNWNMYSPDMKNEQAKFETIDLPFNHAEIETNKIYRAMIHHMICYSKVLTDNFVDVFGKMGLISALCANGYNSAQTWLDDRDYKILLIFKHALKKKDKVLKVLEEIRYEAQHEQHFVKYGGKINEKDENVIYFWGDFLDKKQTVEYYMGFVANAELTLRDISVQDLKTLIEINVPLAFEQLLNLDKNTIKIIIDSCREIENDKQFKVLDKKQLTEDKKKENNKKMRDKKICTVTDIISNYLEKELKIKDIDDEKKEVKINVKIKHYPDIYRFVAYLIIRQYFATEYWLDSNLVVGEDEEGKTIVTSELKEKLYSARMNLFFSKEEGEKYKKELESLAVAYRKKHFNIENIDMKKIINNMKLLTKDTYVLDDDKSSYYIESSTDDTDLLYIDVPKYRREQKRYDFATEWYKDLFSFLAVYRGDWILTWKNYIEVSNVKKSKNSIYYNLYSENKIISLSDRMCLDEKGETSNYDSGNESCVDENKAVLDMDANDNMLTYYKRLLKISEGRQLYVFRYRDEDRNHPNSIMFITTIDFPSLDEEAVKEKYNITFYNKGRLEKLKYEKFYSNMSKWLSKKEGENKSSEESENVNESK